MAIVVQKFGGSSVANPDRIRNVARRIAETVDAGNKVAVVVSAMGDTTDDLIALSKELCPVRPPQREMDMLLSTGEQQSISLLAMTLVGMGYDAISLTGAQAGYMTDGEYARARIVSVNSARVQRELDMGRIVVVAGFQGITPLGEITTLGRGGSDTSAVALAVALEADLCEIYTDVDGVYSADPRIVPQAKKLDEVSYEEMQELASLGAGVLHTRSVELASVYNVALCVRSSFNHNEGTYVREANAMQKNIEKEEMVCGIAHDLNVLKVTIFGVPDHPGVASLVFGELAKAGVNVDMIIQSGTRYMHQDISFTCPREDLDKVEQILTDMVKKLPAENFAIGDTVAKVSVVGAGMISHPGVAATMFRVLYNEGINISMITTSEIKISCIIDESQVKRAVNALHDAFIIAGENK